VKGGRQVAYINVESAVKQYFTDTDLLGDVEMLEYDPVKAGHVFEGSYGLDRIFGGKNVLFFVSDQSIADVKNWRRLKRLLRKGEIGCFLM